MAKRNTSKGSGRRAGPSRADSSKKPFRGKPGGRAHKPDSGKSYGKPRSENSSYSERTARPKSNRKFDTGRSEKSFGEEKTPFRGKKNFSSARSERPYRKSDSDDSKSKGPFKKPFDSEGTARPRSTRKFDTGRSEKSFGEGKT